MPLPIRIVVADDHPLFLRGIVSLVQEQEDFEFVGQAADADAAITLCRTLRPDVALLDLHMPHGGGIAVIEAMEAEGDIKTLVLTVSDRDEDLWTAIETGANGYLLKNTGPDELCDAIRQVAAGRAVLSPEVTAKVMKLAARKPGAESIVSLSPRENEVLAELARGATTNEIAANLIISESTVKTHVRRILDKLEAGNRTEAVARAAQMGLLADGSRRV
jgi:two-component system nitrate/nitrite response regulator NarL